MTSPIHSNQARHWLQSHLRLAVVVSVLLMAVLLGIVYLVIIGPAVNRQFNSVMVVTCLINAQVVIFADNNGDGLQQSGENDIAGVTVTFTSDNADFPQIRASDSSGLASISIDDYCNAYNPLLINVTLPIGYTATTPLNFGPYYISNLGNAPPANPPPPIPKVVYVGLHKN